MGPRPAGELTVAEADCVPPAGTAMRFRVLGPVVAVDDQGRPVVSRGQAAVLLASLLLSANRAVAVSSVTEWLWAGKAMPANSRPVLHNLVSRLRRCLGPDRIQTLPWGYQLNARADELDLLRFTQLTASAQQADADGRGARALTLLSEAIALWQEPLWGNVSAPGLRDWAVPYLTERYLEAVQQRTDLCLRLGQVQSLPAELSALAAAHPYREALTGQLMAGLALLGRPAEALAAYDRLRQALAGGLGIDPSPAVQDLYLNILRSDRASRYGAAAKAGPGDRLAPASVISLDADGHESRGPGCQVRRATRRSGLP